MHAGMSILMNRVLWERRVQNVERVQWRKENNYIKKISKGMILNSLKSFF